jgi:uncharacterized membrane-anchored protein
VINLKELKQLVKRHNWLKHFGVCNLLMFLFLVLYNFTTYLVPLIHLSLPAILVTMILADVLCIIGQVIAE